MAILVFFVAHWQISVFCQTFFLHRYGAHKQFTMSRGWERFFHLLTFFSQGSSYLNPRGYAILHRMHHAFSDTPKDPHSPTNHPGGVRGLMQMMWATKERYDDYAHNRKDPEPRFDGDVPRWDALDRLGQSWIVRVAFGTAYTLFYFKFASTPWLYLLLPAHYVMGPIHGAIVNWCGHKYGYRNFASKDVSKNTLIFDFLTGGELFQNNHHEYGMSPNFAVRWFELDSTYQVIRVLSWLGIVDISGAQKTKWPPRPARVESGERAETVLAEVDSPAE
jgi:stearoyl-CoA desaturase (delta-9 desaturase)